MFLITINGSLYSERTSIPVARSGITYIDNNSANLRKIMHFE